MNSNLKNILIVSDLSWDNYALVNKKLKKIDSENFRVHLLYTRNLLLNNCCKTNELYCLRHSGKNLFAICQNFIKIIDICIIFSNNIEYLNSSQLLKSICEYTRIPYILVSEHSRELDYYSFDNKFKTFKKLINNVNISTNEVHRDLLLTDFFSKEEIILYNENFNFKINKDLFLSDEILTKLRFKYDSIRAEKKSKSIKLLYDKSELKKEKQSRRCFKEYKQLEFGNNRLNYYKTSPVRDEEKKGR